MARLLRTGVDLYLVYRLLRKLTTPFTKTDAYKLGVIDEKGNFLLSKSDMSQEQVNSYTLLDKLIWKIKRLMGKIPGGGSSFASYATALYLILDHKENYLDAEEIDEFDIVSGIVEKMPLAEEVANATNSIIDLAKNEGILPEDLVREFGIAPAAAEGILLSLLATGDLIKEGKKYRVSEIANTAGSGAIAGLGVGPQGEPGRYPKDFAFGGQKVFVVSPEVFRRVRLGKKKWDRYSKYVGVDQVGEDIRQYGRSFPSKPIILMDSSTGCMTYFKFPTNRG